MAFRFTLCSTKNIMIQKFLNNYFGFNKQQRNGFYILCCISICLFIIRLTYPLFIELTPITIENLPLVEEEINSKRALSKNNNYGFNSKAKLFAFDPNTASAEELVKLGLREKTAQTLIKFRSKGFVFKQKTDLKKIYGLSEKLYFRLEPYIVIKHSNNTRTWEKSNAYSKKNSQTKLELNGADSLALIDLKGVGPGYTKRILKYRSILGGFASIEQIKEVYGMTDELYELIKSQCSVNATLLKKININTVDFKVLNKHPYVSYELTKQIFNSRKNGPISEITIKDVIQDDELTNKLLPYLEF